jgi:hypothetical protein
MPRGRNESYETTNSPDPRLAFTLATIFQLDVIGAVRVHQHAGGATVDVQVLSESVSREQLAEAMKKVGYSIIESLAEGQSSDEVSPATRVEQFTVDGKWQGWSPTIIGQLLEKNQYLTIKLVKSLPHVIIEVRGVSALLSRVAIEEALEAAEFRVLDDKTFEPKYPKKEPEV